MLPHGKILSRKFYQRDPVVVAPDLLGKLLVRHYRGFMLSGIIVETEAYRYDDAASHGYKGKTKRTQVLFGQPGHAYVYFTYGNYFCLNAVSHPATMPSGGVLIRSVIPYQGIEIMQRLRHQQNLKNLTNGPGKIGQAFAITRTLNGVDLTHKGPLYLCYHDVPPSGAIKVGPRIGITKDTHRLWRFVLLP